MGWSVDTLFGLTPRSVEWEAERARIIHEFIKSLPPERQKKALLTQLEIEVKQLELGPTEFDHWLWSQITENLENLSDQLVAVKHLVDGPSQSA